MGGSGTLPGGDPMNSVDECEKNPAEHEVGVETAVYFHRDKI